MAAILPRRSSVAPHACVTGTSWLGPAGRRFLLDAAAPVRSCPWASSTHALRLPIASARMFRAAYARRAARAQPSPHERNNKMPILTEQSLHLEENEGSRPKEWKFTGWISTKRDIRAAVEECVANIKPKFGTTKPDICFVFSSHKSDDKLRRIPLLVKNALRPRALFGSSTFGVFGAGGAMTQSQEITDKQAVSVVAATMPDVEIYPFHVNTPSLPSFPPGFDWAEHTLKTRYKYNDRNGKLEEPEETSSALFVITDGVDFREDELLQRLDFAFPYCPKFGGLASSRNVRLFVNDKSYAEGAAGLLLHGKFRLAQIKSEAFRPVGRAYKVSEVIPYDEKRFESLISVLGGSEEFEDRPEWEDDEASQALSSEGQEESEEEDEGDELSSVIHGLDERTVHDVLQELASELSPQDKRNLLAGQFLVGVDPRIPTSDASQSRPPSSYVARNIKEMEIGTDNSEDGSYLALFENIPKDKYIRFCMKDRVNGLRDLQDKLAKLDLPPSPTPISSTATPPVPFCPLALEEAGSSEVGILGFSSIGRSLYAQNTLDQLDLAQHAVLPLTGRMPAAVELNLMVEGALSQEKGNGDEVHDFIEGELATHQPRTSGNFILQPLTEPKTTKNEPHTQDIVDFTARTARSEDKTTTEQVGAEANKQNVDQIAELYEEESNQPTTAEERRGADAEAARGDDQQEDGENTTTDADVIAERLGSRVTLAGMFCKGEFFTAPSSGSTSTGRQDEDDDRTMLHGYINSLAVIMPPQSYYEKKKKDK